jgi:murein L,D-transpeptidase YafK
LSKEKLESIKKQFPDKATQAFWDNLKEGYDKFEANKLVPEVSINATGKYLFK